MEAVDLAQLDAELAEIEAKRKVLRSARIGLKRSEVAKKLRSQGIPRDEALKAVGL